MSGSMRKAAAHGGTSYSAGTRPVAGRLCTWQCVKHLTACIHAIGKRHISMNSKRKCPYLRVIDMTEFTQPLPAAFQIQDLVNELGVIYSHRLQAAREQRPSLQRHRKHLKSGQSCRKLTVLLVRCFTERGLQSHSSALCTHLAVPLFWGRGHERACSGIILHRLNSLTRDTAHQTKAVLDCRNPCQVHVRLCRLQCRRTCAISETTSYCRHCLHFPWKRGDVQTSMGHTR